MTLGRLLTGLGSFAVLGIGAGALAFPAASTRTYGIITDDLDTHAYIRAIAARDLVMGAFCLWATIANDRKAMEAALLTCTLAPIADFAAAYERRGWIPQLAIHGSGVAGILVAWWILRTEDV
jgi:hypothetical protein